MKINNNTIPRKERILSSCIEYKAKLEGEIPVLIDITEWGKNEFSADIYFKIEGDEYIVHCPQLHGGRTTKTHIIPMINKFLKILGYTGKEVKA